MVVRRDVKFDEVRSANIENIVKDNYEVIEIEQFKEDVSIGDNGILQKMNKPARMRGRNVA